MGSEMCIRDSLCAPFAHDPAAGQLQNGTKYAKIAVHGPAYHKPVRNITTEGYLMIRVLFICHGNICRSTMAESIMTYLVKQAGVEDQFYINSAATSCEEIGNPPHSGTVAKLKAEGIPVIPHRAVQMTLNDYEEYDYLIGMDTENIRNMQRLSGGDPDEKVYKLMTFAGSGSDVADPWYTGDFEATYKDVRKGCEGLLKVLMNL